ncbi:hypothetical protein GOP47_0024752 [Adiantum capillus-veneris]|uniref:cytokinin dehydrogenase n=1 Tax=Adiantum capillus-veneris TaxID=13818 RepID=A0A9D4U2U9_ADICA|nr:hypothetical protein GOP47_0024752 [Adiantum capillus-veneris]
MVTAPVVAGAANCVKQQAAGEQAEARTAIQTALRAESRTLNISFDNVAMAASDFGGLYHHRPSAMVSPATVEDIARVMRALSRVPNVTVAARGNGHSINGQAQALHGVVIDMRSVKDPSSASISVGKEADGSFYADVGAGRLWIEVLDATLRHPGLPLAPRTWPDYLHLSVGGTLQNAGIGGQTFKHGPQISNVSKLDVITVNGELKSCSPTSNGELFYASLGGLGQFGIITKARILLEPAPQKVRWIRLVYVDFKEFTQDQERLICNRPAAFDYVEGFIVTNNNDAAAGWPQVPLPEGAFFNHRLLPANAGPMLYCLEVAKYYNACDTSTLGQQISGLLRALRFVEGLHFQVDVSYRDFLDRVHTGEPHLRNAGLWDAPHPWVCLFVPRSQIVAFDTLIFKHSKLVSKGVGGPMLVYPMLRSKWDHRTSAVIPEEEVFYLVALLRFSLASPRGPTAERLVEENEEIVRLARAANIHVKYYLPHFNRQADWQDHFGCKWNHFRHLKSKWDPQAVLSPGLSIFSPPATSLFRF